MRSGENSGQRSAPALRAERLIALGAAALAIVCCVAGPALVGALGGLALGSVLAPALAVLLAIACVIVAARLAGRKGRRP
jgi:hypothetical protein